MQISATPSLRPWRTQWSDQGLIDVGCVAHKEILLWSANRNEAKLCRSRGWLDHVSEWNLVLDSDVQLRLNDVSDISLPFPSCKCRRHGILAGLRSVQCHDPVKGSMAHHRNTHGCYTGITPLGHTHGFDCSPLASSLTRMLERRLLSPHPYAATKQHVHCTTAAFSPSQLRPVMSQSTCTRTRFTPTGKETY